MTVNTTSITSGPYVGNGIASAFSYTFKVDDKTQLKVYETDIAGTQTLLTVDTDYTVAGVGTDGGGILTRVAGALPTDYKWFIRSNYVETQLTAFSSQGAFFPGIHEDAMDKLTFLIQQMLDTGDRSVRLSDTETPLISTVLANVATRSGKALAFTSSGELDYIAGSMPVGSFRVYTTMAALLADVTNTTIGDSVYLEERVSGDSQGAWWKIVDESTVTENTYDIVAGDATRSFKRIGSKTIYLSTVSEISGNVNLKVGDRVEWRGYYAESDGGSGWGTVKTGAHTDDGGLILSIDANYYVEQNLKGKSINVRKYGIVADDTDQYAKIEKALVKVRANRSKLYFPCNLDGTNTLYSHATPLSYEASDVVIEGESTRVQLKYTGVGTGLLCKVTPGGSSIERWGLKNITLLSATGAKGLDFTGGNYGECNNVEVNYTTASAELIYAIGNSGAGPYFNKFDGITLFGDTSRTQDGIVLKSDSSGNLADGPNANIFSSIKRGASLRRLVNLVAGTGNLFSNISGESIKDALVVLNDAPSFADSGTSTSTTSNTLTDTSKVWSVTPGDPLNFIGAAVKLTSGIPGETRRITSNTVDALTLDKPFSQNPGGTVTYQISKGKAVKNMFVNVRQEGLASDNPDGIRCMPGARGNEFSQLEIGSLGTGAIFDDQSQDQSNKVRQGDLIVMQYVIENPGASTTIEVIPRSGAEGGIRSGSNMTLEYVEMLSPNFVTGSATATLTVDHGGAATGAGTETQIVIIDDVTNKSAYKSANKVLRSTINNGIFASLTTNANVNASSDFIINIGVRVQ